MACIARRFRKALTRISPENHEDLRNFDSIAIDPHDPNTIYAGTYHLPWKTVDGGRPGPGSQRHGGRFDVMSITITRQPVTHFRQRVFRHLPQLDGAGPDQIQGNPERFAPHGAYPSGPETPAHGVRRHYVRPLKTSDDGATRHLLTPRVVGILSMLIDPKIRPFDSGD